MSPSNEGKLMELSWTLYASIGNPGLLRSYTLILVGCMHLSLGISKSKLAENNGFKTILE